MIKKRNKSASKVPGTFDRIKRLGSIPYPKYLRNKVPGTWIVIIFLALFLFVTAACSSRPDLDTPPDIRYGEDVCDQCQMIINESRYAASYVTETGEVRRFDDIGGMFVYTQEVSENISVFWVHDYDTEQWIKGEEAHYVAADGLRTPMGFDIVAFSTQEQADTLAAETGGALHTFSSLMDLAEAGDIELAHEHEE